MDSDTIASRFPARVFVADRAVLSLLSLPSNVITLKEGVSGARFLHGARAAQNSFGNLSSGTGMLQKA